MPITPILIIAAAVVLVLAAAGCQDSHSKPPSKAAAPADNNATVAVVVMTSATPQPYPQPEPANLNSFIELARRDIQLQKAAIIADNISFTEGEAARFWPIYREYEAELYAVNNQKLELIKEFLPTSQQLSDESARKLAREAFAIDDQRTALKRKYFSKLQEVIPPAKAARFIQIENQLNMVLDLRLAAALPLIK